MGWLGLRVCSGVCCSLLLCCVPYVYARCKLCFQTPPGTACQLAASACVTLHRLLDM